MSGHPAVNSVRCGVGNGPVAYPSVPAIMGRPPLGVEALRPDPLHALESIESGPWLPVASCSFPFGLDLFFAALDEVVRHPERNSSSILRTDILQDSTTSDESPIQFKLFRPSRVIRRRLMPRRPFDGPLLQSCIFFRHSSEDSSQGLLVMLPQLDSPLPFYHPKVAGIAFSFWHNDPNSDPTMRVDYLPHNDFPFPDRPSPEAPTLPPSSRLYRTALALLDSVHTHGYGRAIGYEKRVNHDLLVPREAYQDLYLEMKERWSWVTEKWVESTDSSKHVFEVSALASSAEPE
jgi:tRNASer (uridine44-2'-O)-methyltransferase